jgi:UrcA family protein
MFQLIRSTLLACLACSATVHNACAEEPTEKVGFILRVRVPLDDLDLRKETDARLLLSRLEKAAYRACGGNPRFHTSYEVMPERTTKVFRDCRERAITQAVDRINAPTLKQLLLVTRQ